MEKLLEKFKCFNSRCIFYSSNASRRQLCEKCVDDYWAKVERQWLENVEDC